MQTGGKRPGMPDGDCSREVATLYSVEGVLILRDFGLVCAPTKLLVGIIYPK
jgi:hypothetical protein